MGFGREADPGGHGHGTTGSFMGEIMTHLEKNLTDDGSDPRR
ncbi:hypothetical protein ACFRCG_02985 [Embleya sp. NPDC056575]